MIDTKEWRFEALDSWFFRESRPHGLVGGIELASLFPPPARTVAGAVRTLIGESQRVDWDKFNRNAESYPDLRAQIGNAQGLGRLRLTGPYLIKDGQRLYPAPLHLLAKVRPNAGGYDFTRLRPGPPVCCDLDASLPVRLPEMETPQPGAKPLENTWLDGADLTQVLAGGVPERPYRKDDLFTEEPRVGIARDNSRRTAAEGMLYQTRHIRPYEGVEIAAGVAGIDKAFQPAGGLLRFGGEGRPAAVTVAESSPSLQPPQPDSAARGLLLVLLTHADFGGEWLPPGFGPMEREGARVWSGELHGVRLTLECAVLGKVVREGGWDLAGNKPRPMTSLVPAGSVYFCTVEGDPGAAIQALHGSHIGNDTELGRGELAIGLWK